MCVSVCVGMEKNNGWNGTMLGLIFLWIPSSKWLLILGWLKSLVEQEAERVDKSFAIQ
jgi:hypothetical protein